MVRDIALKLAIYKSFRYRIYPTASQIAKLDEWSHALRALWNLAHEQRLLAYTREKSERKYPTRFDQINDLTELREYLPWLKAVPRNIAAQLLTNLDTAWKRCFDKISKVPRWKRRYRDLPNLCEPGSKIWTIKNGSLYFPKIKQPIRIVQHRPLEGTRKSCTISRDGDQWFASILCQVESDPIPRTEPVVGIDLGITALAATSDGELIENPQYLKASLRQLAHAQRAVERKKRGSRNQAKARLRVARIHRKTRRQRHHHLHVQSSRLAKNHGIVVIENLNVDGMIRGNLSRSISDVGWSIFTNQLRYKLAWSGGSVIEVPAAYSSQTCNVCEHVDKASRKTQANFVCTRCGHAENADINAAKVLKHRANRSVKPVEGISLKGTRRSRKAKVEKSTSAKPRPSGRG